MQRKLLIIATAMGIIFGPSAFKLHASPPERSAEELAAKVIEAAVEAFAGPDWGPKWEKQV